MVRKIFLTIKHLKQATILGAFVFSFQASAQAHKKGAFFRSKAHSSSSQSKSSEKPKLFEGLFKPKTTTTNKKPSGSTRTQSASKTPAKSNFLQNLFKSSGAGKVDKSPGRIESVSSGSNVTTRRYISANYLNSRLKGKLAGKASVIISAAKQNGIDPVFLASVMAFETGWGTSPKVRNQNNPGGLTSGSRGRYASFSTIDEGINAMASRLRSRYVDRGITSVASIARVYAPPGASNDPRGTNYTWPRNVTTIMNKLISGSVNAT